MEIDKRPRRQLEAVGFTPRATGFSRSGRLKGFAGGAAGQLPAAGTSQPCDDSRPTFGTNSGSLEPASPLGAGRRGGPRGGQAGGRRLSPSARASSTVPLLPAAGIAESQDGRLPVQGVRLQMPVPYDAPFGRLAQEIFAAGSGGVLLAVVPFAQVGPPS